MSYLTEYAELRSGYVREGSPSPIGAGQFEFTRWTFESAAQHLLPGRGPHSCAEHAVVFPESRCTDAEAFDTGDEVLDIPDSGIETNRRFEYQILAPAGQHRFTSATALLHGLNEQHWEKCLPWALGLVQRTGRPVILMPLPLHMHRARGEWCQSRRMQRVAQHRQALFADLTASSFSNAAISTRLHARPGRFFWSMLQCCEDVALLARMLRDGRHPLFGEGAGMDFFGYSIGAFLSQMLLFSDAEGLCSASRAFLFCGGATLDRMHLAERAILDSRAETALKGFFGAGLDGNCSRDPRLEHYLSEAHAYGVSFRMLLAYNRHREEREVRLRRCGRRIAAVLLRADTVVPPDTTLSVLLGERNDTGIDAAEMDFPYPYSHIMPFPLQSKYEADVEAALNAVLDRAANVLS